MSKSFRTEICLKPPNTKINLNDKIFTIGSCFSNHIGSLLSRYKFKVMANPFGNIFNPISTINLLQHALLRETISDSKIIQNQGMFYHYDFHSEVTSADSTTLSNLICEKIVSAGTFLQKTDVLTITFGTAYVYRLLENKEVVANCHKMPAKYFKKELLTPEQIILAFNEMYKLLPRHTQIILTVSPVRHIKDTITLNSVSKSVLRLACHHLSEQHPNIHYFPAYEMLMDDLRDYRFYETDMLHPNGTAINYVWDHFHKAFIDEEGNRFINKWDKLIKALEHRPFNPETEEHQQFLVNTLNRLKEIKEVDVSKERKMLENKLQLYSF